jgi:hypothetical protein
MAGILIEILNQPWSGIGIQVVNDRVLGHMDLLAVDKDRDRDDHGEFLRVSLVIIGYGDDRSVAIPDQYNPARPGL